MNEEAIAFWNDYWGDAYKPQNVRAYRYGDTPDELAAMVVAGEKTASSNAKRLFELNNLPIPAPGDYHIILNKQYKPVVLIQVESVSLIPYDEVNETFAIAEGDGTYENWDEIHIRFFKEEFAKHNEVFHSKIELICQTFKVLKVNTDLD